MDLRASDLARLARLWSELEEEVNPGDLPGFASTLHTKLTALLGVEHGFLLFASRDPAARASTRLEPRAHLTHGPDAARRARIAGAWRARASWRDDPHVRGVLRALGQPRSFLRRDIVDDRSWDRAPSRQLLQELDVRERMVGAVGVAPGLELFTGVDRARGERAFVARERDLLALALSGVVGVARRVCSASGMLAGGEPLTAREAQVLRLLLDGAAEKDVARALDVSLGYTHRLVLRLYCKRGVRSRAELLVQVLRPQGSGGGAGPLSSHEE